MSELITIGNVRVLKLAYVGAALERASDANLLLEQAFSTDAEFLVIPVERLGPNFLKLSTGVAGEVFQKFVNYKLRCAIVGDIGEAVMASRSLGDFVRETNNGNSIWFVADFEDLWARLSDPSEFG
jgi:hypothetical protein